MKPNILFISCDQQRWDCLGFNGRYPVKTPNIDLLAAEGICFDQSYTPLPTCAPARQALVCGKRPESFGALCNFDQGIPVSSLGKDAYSWARDLQNAGYRTGYIGNWHVSPTLTPLDFGYETYIPTWKFVQKQQELYPDLRYQKGFYGEVSPYPIEHAVTHLAADRAIEMIDAYREEPWHIKLDYVEPHLPCRPSEPFASMYEKVPKWTSFDDSLEEKPYMHRQMLRNWDTQNMTWEDMKETVRLYYGYISQADDAIGKVIRHLKEIGQLDNTVVIYTADHGDMCCDRHMMDKHYIMYDSVTRVPLVIRYPALIKEGRRCDTPITNMLDLVPTILELAGLPVPEGLDAVTLTPYLRGEEHPTPRKYALCTYNGQQFGLYTQRMIRDRRWKYVWNPSDIDELYDTEADPAELHNLIYDPAYAETRKQLRRDMVKELDAVGDYTMKSYWLREILENDRKV